MNFDKSKMLHDLSWLDKGKTFPPYNEQFRIGNYKVNRKLFHSELPDEYLEYANRISRVIGNFEEYVSFPIVFSYPKLITLKMADLVCGEYPEITGEASEVIDQIRMDSDFDAKLYATVIDISRYGDAIWRIYKDKKKNRYTFTVWDPAMWFPIVSQDGTNTEIKHVLCWVENRGTDFKPDWYLTAQIHEDGYYIEKVFKTTSYNFEIEDLVSESKVPTGLSINAVVHLKAFTVSDTVYGDDDYADVDSILSELATRVAQVSSILDKHADPILTGPTTLLEKDPITGKLSFKPGRFYATMPEDNQPEYLTWNGELEASFKQMDFLINQLYILSEMGSALVGDHAGSTQVISGSAMRFKMVSPLAKARRIANAMTLPIQKVLSEISAVGYKKKIDAIDISVSWKDGLPNDPREDIENTKLATGENSVMPLKNAIMKFLDISSKEADTWIEEIDKRAEAASDTTLDPDPRTKGSKQDVRNI